MEISSVSVCLLSYDYGSETRCRRIISKYETNPDQRRGRWESLQQNWENSWWQRWYSGDSLVWTGNIEHLLWQQMSSWSDQGWRWQGQVGGCLLLCNISWCPQLCSGSETFLGTHCRLNTTHQMITNKAILSWLDALNLFEFSITDDLSTTSFVAFEKISLWDSILERRNTLSIKYFVGILRSDRRSERKRD